CQQFTSSPYTF
nr:immunoglobulin light chain junction region [Mus musculus]